jgi:hypothetical protein
MGDYCFTAADEVIVVLYVWQLSARRARCVENMLMSERKLCESEKRKYFQPITVIIGNSTEFWIGIECQHDSNPRVAGAKANS